MTSRKYLLKKSNIYAIVDIDNLKGKNLSNFIYKCLKNKIKIFQLRSKKSSWEKVLDKSKFLKKVISNKALLIINDYPEICALVGGDGVHLGQKDLPVFLAKQILNNSILIGKSTHSIRQAILAKKEKVDYIGFGPIFKTNTKRIKPIGIKQINKLSKLMNIPFFLIGGINFSTLKDIKLNKTKRIAVSNALCKSRNLKLDIAQLKSNLN